MCRSISLTNPARAEVANSMLFGTGDLLQGNSMGDLAAKVRPLQNGQVHPACKLMNRLAPDAGNLGNQVLSFG